MGVPPSDQWVWWHGGTLKSIIPTEHHSYRASFLQSIISIKKKNYSTPYKYVGSKLSKLIYCPMKSKQYEKDKTKPRVDIYVVKYDKLHQI